MVVPVAPPFAACGGAACGGAVGGASVGGATVGGATVAGAACAGAAFGTGGGGPGGGGGGVGAGGGGVGGGGAGGGGLGGGGGGGARPRGGLGGGRGGGGSLGRGRGESLCQRERLGDRLGLRDGLGLRGGLRRGGRGAPRGRVYEGDRRRGQARPGDILVAAGDEVGERTAAVIHRERGRRSHRGPFGGERQQFAARSAKKRARTVGMTLAAEVPQVITANLAGFHSGGDGMSQRATRHRARPCSPRPGWKW